MTNDKKRIEEIRSKSDDGTFGGTYTASAVDFLLAQIDKRDEALRAMLKEFGGADLVWTQRKAVSDAREALGDE